MPGAVTLNGGVATVKYMKSTDMNQREHTLQGSSQGCSLPPLPVAEHSTSRAFAASSWLCHHWHGCVVELSSWMASK